MSIFVAKLTNYKISFIMIQSSSLPPIKQRLFDADLINFISWAEISRKYFGKSNSWLYHKLNGVDGNKKPTDFSEDERESLKEALTDLSARLKSFADSL